MSSTAAENITDLDFWEFVSCAKCHLPYASEPGKSIPFWLTECGHVICNNHLNPEQSCASCGSTGILLVPLQQEVLALENLCAPRLPKLIILCFQLDAPMSDWFKSIPAVLDLAAFAAKFQQEAMARQIRFFRGRHQQIRVVLEKLRSEIAELKRTNEVLVQENNQLKQQLGLQDFRSEGGHEPLNVTNRNGKRQMGIPAYQYDYPPGRPRTGSSPLHGSTPPIRLTLPTTQRTTEPPPLHESSRPLTQMQPDTIPSPQHRSNQGNTRPMSRQIGKFAYIPPESSHAPITSLSHAQMAPKLIRPSQFNQSKQNGYTRSDVQPQAIQHRVHSQQPVAQQSRLGTMGPPPVPQARLGTPAVTSGGTRQTVIPSRRSVPPQRHQQQPSTSHGPQRFFPRDSSSTSGSWSNSGGKSSGVDYG